MAAGKGAGQCHIANKPRPRLNSVWQIPPTVIKTRESG
jgi:hypothetical protein